MKYLLQCLIKYLGYLVKTSEINIYPFIHLTNICWIFNMQWSGNTGEKG